jgi:hypothetical protein
VVAPTALACDLRKTGPTVALVVVVVVVVVMGDPTGDAKEGDTSVHLATTRACSSMRMRRRRSR